MLSPKARMPSRAPSRSRRPSRSPAAATPSRRSTSSASPGASAISRPRAARVRELARKASRTVAIMCDLQGPKIRVGKFRDGKVVLEKSRRFILDASCELGDAERVGLDYKELPRDVEPGAVLLLDDGK